MDRRYTVLPVEFQSRTIKGGGILSENEEVL